MKKQSYVLIIKKIILYHFDQVPTFIKHIAIGICNEVYAVGLRDKEIIVRLSPYNKFLMGSHDHIPKLKALGITVPDILAEDYSKTRVSLAYQIQTKIEGHDLGIVIETLTDDQLKKLAKEIVMIFNKIKTIPASNTFGVIWGGGNNDTSDTWTERMRIWIDESVNRGKQTGIIDEKTRTIAENLYAKYESYFDSVRPITYCGDINYKNVMIHNGALSGLVDLDGLTQGDPLEAIGRIKISWYATHHGNVYTNAIMDALNLSEEQRQLVSMYALLNQISLACENGIQFNQNTRPIVNKKKELKDKKIIQELASELHLGPNLKHKATLF